MKIAILSDIHSNKYAFGEALKLISGLKADHYFFIGDFFGYYPWALETYNLIKTVRDRSTFVIGNHDELMITANLPKPVPEYWDVLEHNKKQLNIEAINWLNSLRSHVILNIDDIKFSLYHGTPDDELNGRFYPDNETLFDWFPSKNEVLILGHTHYKLLKKTEKGGVVLNPGSVGQPRGKSTKPSFAIMDTRLGSAEFIEIEYDIASAIKELEDMNWYPRAIESLKRAAEN